MCRLFAFLCCASILVANPPPEKKGEAFTSFTGKIAANKVRLRVKPDLESHILRQANKNDLFLIVGEEGDFYAIDPPKGTKAYVFRSYVLEDRVEVNRINVRLEPHPDAPIIGQLKEGALVQGQICPMAHKWLEIPMPQSTRFYISKEYVVNAGGPELFASMEKKHLQMEGQLNSTIFATAAECKKPFEEMNPQPLIDKLQSMVRDFSDFPETVGAAKEALSLLKETYLNKKIAYLEARAELSEDAKEELLAKHRTENAEIFAETPSKRSQKLATTTLPRWDALEEALYLSWSAFHTGKKVNDFYLEQTANAYVLTGKIESYQEPIKDRPGDFLFSGPDGQIAYLYSTQVDLNSHLGREVTLLAAPRPNNHFAYPAYFVLKIE